MCGRYTLFVDPDDLEERFDATFAEPFEPRYNAAPGQRLPVIADDEPETIHTLEWGFVPPWADDDANAPINARAETVAETPTFRDAYRRDGAAGRCLVLADGFYEWVETKDGKRPYRVAFEDGRPFAMAGLRARWEPPTTQASLAAFGDGADPEDDGRETFAVVTTEPNDLVADLHHRMAVVLDPGDERRWLTGDDPSDLLAPHPAEEMRADPVSTAVNSPANDDPSLVEPVE
ncbi:SOS response-associated peptidase [Salinilacihabitans rarus]|uniref:SOS response-associated peptidase n=1 Tax=Salinilacihabitans rarus TaxID=2961596 RepID=UPI0020C8C4E5|nr:SOS response-associated peptidase [Salinilacihabitans rarus]